jgi:hypothetical protein
MPTAPYETTKVYSRHSGRDSRQAIPPAALRVNANLFQTDLCRNPDYMDVFKFAIHGTGYPLPGGYDELPAHLYITASAPAWELLIIAAKAAPTTVLRFRDFEGFAFAITTVNPGTYVMIDQRRCRVHEQYGKCHAFRVGAPGTNHES